MVSYLHRPLLRRAEAGYLLPLVSRREVSKSNKLATQSFILSRARLIYGLKICSVKVQAYLWFMSSGSGLRIYNPGLQLYHGR